MTTAQQAVRDIRSDIWVATDALGRTLPGNKECGSPKKNKTVGIFYFLWTHRQHDPGVLYDNTKLIAANPANPQYGPEGSFHWWGEPHLGYYYMDDPFVIRKHAQMLTDAGVDVIILDVTNALTYDDTFLAICREYEAIRKTGRTTPQIAFLANSNSARTVRHLYDTFYSKNLYPDLWFRWKGKPLLMAPEEGLSPEELSFFTVRQSWAWTDPKGWFGNGKDKWPWIENYPQQPGWHESPEKPEEISVCTAQHATSNIGRSYHDGKEPPPERIAPEQGLCFAEQWKRALEVDAEFVFITGWNEWIAQRFTNKGGIHFLGRALEKGETFFVDQYNQEYSRDIEPMRGGHGDDYYYQMVANIRRYKGVRADAKASAAKTIRINSDFKQWQSVGPEFLDDIGDTLHRNSPGFGKSGPYVNDTGRNDFEMMKVARDAQNLYFFVRTREPITAPDGKNWMLLLLDTDGDARNGWEGYDYRVNCGSGKGILEKNAGGWNWAPAGTVKFAVSGREMHLAVSRAALHLPSGKNKLRLDFKWADNIPNSGDILDFLDHGDVAPNGRFNFRYEE